MASSMIFIVAFIAASSIPATLGFLHLPVGLPDLSPKSLLPKCEFNGTSATCCSAMANMMHNQLCATLKVNPNELNVGASLSFNNKTMVEQKVAVGKMCAPVGGVVPLMACLQFYWVEIGLGKPNPLNFSSNICFQGTVTKIASVDFQCLRFENGKFSRNSEHKPSSHGWIHLNTGK